ncbi:MAG: ATP-grasp domain-containing protein [Candidatus Andersenbacteria bacterium]|nr:ATP-grasp domain-containing protein [bacterium]MDZ4225279.1 ATP-grasp domain-containing protein [Candidatus Andersenbacteria bacterium]
MAEFIIYTKLIVEEARRRGFKITAYPEINRNYAELEYKGHKEKFYQAMGDNFGQASHKILFHKELAATLLREAGFPVPDSVITGDYGEAEDFLKSHARIVVKPVGRCGGIGITVNVRSEEELKEAFGRAKRNTRSKLERVICQEMIDGDDNRLLVLDQYKVFAARRVPAHVIGDGKRTVAQLVEKWNKKVVEMRHIKLDEDAEKVLREQELTRESVPADGVKVKLCHLANAHRGAIIEDVTDTVSPEAKALAIEVARYFKCPFIGIDMIAPDITKQAGKIIELNPHAGIVLHHFPTAGKPRNVAGAIIDMLFPEQAKP